MINHIKRSIQNVPPLVKSPRGISTFTNTIRIGRFQYERTELVKTLLLKGMSK